MKKIFYFFIVISIFFTLLSIMKISTMLEEIPTIIINKDDSIGTIIIHKINIKEPLYAINSSKNTIDQHVSILKESTSPKEENSTLILAAHSGTGGVAFFKDLKELQIKDEIDIIYENKKYTYTVKEIWKEKKTGYIHINKEIGKQLILTTCDPIEKEYQIIVNCIEKE